MTLKPNIRSHLSFLDEFEKWNVVEHKTHKTVSKEYKGGV